jgi:hypothetical protein
MNTKINDSKATDNLIKKSDFKLVKNIKELIPIYIDNKIIIDGTPKITSNRKAIIVYDNKLFQVSYLIDLILDAIEFETSENKHKFDNIDILYINDKNIACNFIYNKSILEIPEVKLFPCIICINPFSNHIVELSESLQSTITVDGIIRIMTWLFAENKEQRVFGKNSYQNKLIEF